jgi:hypothetical protein
VTVRRSHLALLAVLVPLAAGCGAGLRDTLSLDPVASAATKTQRVTSARVAFTGSFAGPWADQRFSFDGSGILDGASGAGSMHFAFRFPPALSGTLGANASMDMIVQSKPHLVMYMRSPLFARSLPGAKAWLKMDLTKFAATKGVDLGSLQQLNQTDPMQDLHYLTGASASRELGYDQVRGVFTKHYALTIDLNRLAKGNRRLHAALDRLRGAMGTKIPAEAWVDDQGLLRKLALNFTLANTPDGPFRMSLSEELYDFGAKVRVRTPPASQVTDATKLLGR